jgi:protein kinase-like protein
MTLQTGARLGAYEIRGPLGSGGMGEVYLAWDARLGREVAVKVLGQSAATDTDRLRRFEQEAKAAGALNHPNILAVYDVGSHESAPYIVSELLEGDTLRGQIRAGGITPRKAVEHTIQIARGLAATHQRKTDGSPAVFLGEYRGLALSPDGRFVLALPAGEDYSDRLLVVPTGAGERRELRHASLQSCEAAAWFPDGRRIAVVSREGRDRDRTPRRRRLFVWDVDMSAPPRALSPPVERIRSPPGSESSTWPRA